MLIGKILDPELPKGDIEAEIEAIREAVSGVGYRSYDRSSSVDDRVFIDISGFGEDIYRAFCYKFPELKERLIPVREVNYVRR